MNGGDFERGSFLFWWNFKDFYIFRKEWDLKIFFLSRFEELEF